MITRVKDTHGKPTDTSLRVRDRLGNGTDEEWVWFPERGPLLLTSPGLPGIPVRTVSCTLVSSSASTGLGGSRVPLPQDAQGPLMFRVTGHSGSHHGGFQCAPVLWEERVFPSQFGPKQWDPHPN